jgi:two-component system sensor histidine kinase CssS
LVSRWINKLSSSVLKLNSYLLKYSNDYKDAPTSTSEINSLFKNFNDYRKTLLKKDDEKQVLFQNISHELKTPITTIKMYSEAIQDGIYDEDNIQNATNIIIKETNNLLEKVNKIMQINKLSYLESVNKGVTIIDKVSISDILFEVVNNYNVIHPEIKFNVNLISIDYRGTKDVWKNVFENIFDNNIRNKATTIEITLNDKYLIIENNGEKIPQDFMPSLFEPFKKGQNGNFGLGLNIIKKSLELYNYSIKIENSKIGVLYFITDNK